MKVSKIIFESTGKAGLKIEFGYNPTLINLVKTLSGRKFHAEPYGKFWTCPMTLSNISLLKEWGFFITSDIIDYMESLITKIEDVVDVEIPPTKFPLFEYQKKGVSFIEAKNGRVLIADEMGLGKTCQALTWVNLHPEKKPVVIVVPASLKLNWERECKIWINNPNTQIISGKKPYPLTGEIIIINYDIVGSWLVTLISINPVIIITDECHKWKNPDAKRTKAIKTLARRVPHIIALSGSPIENRPVEIYNVINVLAPEIAGSYRGFTTHYCAGHQNHWGWDASGASNIPELHEKLTGTIMIRRKKEDVLKDLPGKIRSIVPMELKSRRNYDRAERDFIEFVKSEKGLMAAEKASKAEALARISALKQIAAQEKLEGAIDWIKDHLDTNGKLVVFGVHKNIINQVMDALIDYHPVKVDGTTPNDIRQKNVDTFQNDDSCRVFIGNIQAAGVGLTLTAASSVCFVEINWGPMEHDQAEDRCHRIGQKECVNVYYLMAQNTIEESIAELIDEKRKIITQLIDGADVIDNDLFSEIIKKFK